MTKLKNDKAPGLEKVSPLVFKVLNDYNLSHLLDFFKKYWLEETDFDEWQRGQNFPVPKSGDLSEPNKCRGITLMETVAKIFSSILCGHKLKIIKSHGVKYQFESTPRVGFHDGRFSVKTLLHLRNNHNLPILFAFSDLVKAFYASYHKLT